MLSNFGLSGIWGHWESTVTAIIGVAATAGFITAAQGAGLDTTLTALVGLISAVASLAKLFYKGPAAPATPKA
jgi:hypothetical protein